MPLHPSDTLLCIVPYLQSYIQDLRAPPVLDVKELVQSQQLSHRFLSLCRDDGLWKVECFNSSRAETRRRRQQIDATNTQLSALRSAFSDFSGQSVQDLDQNSAKTSQSVVNERQRALANWDPSYADEKLNFYDEYIHRHAPINIGWLPVSEKAHAEATGVGLIYDSGYNPEHIVAPFDDGSVCIWDIRPRSADSYLSQGQFVGRSSIGLLTGGLTAGQSKAIMTETGAVESVSIDNRQKKGYFAQNNTLVEVDLSTLQVVSQESFPFPITALSPTRHSSLIVGTNCTIHIHDPRNKSKLAVDPSLQCELIGGPLASHATLSQPGPLSILERPEDDSIWVAGRFTHLLNYDRRFFPRIRGTVHSGGRISCISSVPHSYIPRSLDLLQNPSVGIGNLNAAKSIPGTTILAAGEYKGKGSLEFYGLASPSSSSLVSGSYQNRQTASSTRLLSVAAHGSSTVFSDGDGNLKWVERDGTTTIRSHNINEYTEPLSSNQAQSAAQREESHDWREEQGAQREDEQGQGDIVQKIVPLRPYPAAWSSSRPDVNQSDLMLKTGDGRIGILGFGHVSLYEREETEGETETTEQKAKKDAEKQYQETLRRALQRQADEVRFMRGLGMAFNNLG